MADPAGVDMEASAEAYEREVTIHDVESGIAAELDGVTLVGEIDLDHWGQLAEAVLPSALRGNDLQRVERLWPATLVTYLVHQGIHAYEESTYWPNVSLAGLRAGPAVGPHFEAALRRLHLPTFDDLEVFEGIGKHTRGRYIRRIHLHGGLPRNATDEVLELLAATLRSGAASAQEVVSRWSSMDLSNHLRSRAAIRLFTYTGDFGVGLVDQLIELLRIANRKGDLRVDGIASHLIDGVMEYIEKDRSGSTPVAFIAGPQVLLSLSGGPELKVPRASEQRWAVDGMRSGLSSRQVEMTFPLAPPKGGEWTVSAKTGFVESTYRFVSANGIDPIFVFDERHRLHYRATTLGGVLAYVLAPMGTDVSDAIDVRSAGPGWPDHEVTTCDLRGVDTIQIEPVQHSPILLPVDNQLGVRLAGDVVDGVTTAKGHPVLSYYVHVAFGRYLPDLSGVDISINGSEYTLDQFEEVDGEIDISGALAEAGTTEVHLVLSRPGVDPVELRFAHLPGLRIDRPVLAPPHTDVDVTISSRAQGELARRDLVFRDNETRQRTTLRVGSRVYELDVELNRLLWARSGSDIVAPLLDAEPVLLSVSELRESALHIRSGGIPMNVALLDADVPHQVRPRLDRHRPDVATAPLRTFADTARSATAPRMRVALVSSRTDEQIEVGVVESRYEPWDIEVDQVTIGAEDLIDVSWTELREWPNRVVRIWPEADVQEVPKPIVTGPVEPGTTSLSLSLPTPEPGWYLLEVTTKSGWGSPRRPEVGPGCVKVHLGSPEAKRLQTAILTADRREPFSDKELDDLVPVLADLMVKLAPGNAAPDLMATVALPKKAEIGQTAASAQTARTTLYEKVADDHWRAIDVLDEVADHYEIGVNGEGREALEPMLIELMPLLFDFPIRDTDATEAVRLENLWLTVPLAAVCLDAARTDERCHQRWIGATGTSTAVKDSVSTSLQRLADRVPRKSPTPVAEAPLLGPGAWGFAIRSHAREGASRRARDLGVVVRPLATDLWRMRNGEVPRWSSSAMRLQDQLKGYAPQPLDLTSLAVLALAHLDCETPRRSVEVLDALHAAQELFPDAVRTTLIYAATCLRILEDAGALSKLEKI